MRYIATLDGPIWRGEIAIPWKTISAERGRPVLLRFNFTQHRTDTGESASWADPIDFGRDDAFTGLLFIRDNLNAGFMVVSGMILLGGLLWLWGARYLARDTARVGRGA